MHKTIKGTEKMKDIKVLERSINTADRMKGAFIKTKEKAEHGLYTDKNSPNTYAVNHISESAEKLGLKAADGFDNFGKKKINSINQNMLNAYNKAHRIHTRKATALPKEMAIKQAQDSISHGIHTARQDITQNPQSIANGTHHSGRMIKQSRKAMKPTAKGSIKTAKKSIKTAENTARMAIKKAQQVAKATQKTAKASAQLARITARATITATKTTIKATISTVRAIIAGTKLLVSAIIAGGWIAVMIILIICLIGLLAGSSFGIFFSGEDSKTGQNMQSAVQEINQDYHTEIERIKAENPHDVLEMTGSRALWPEVLSVYAVLTTTDPDTPQEVATMDNQKKALLKSIFWEMHEIRHRAESKTETIIEISDDGNGNIVETKVTVTRSYLYITVNHKTAEDMAIQCNFKPAQYNQLVELLSDSNSGLWHAVLYGISSGSSDIVQVALSQVGNVGGELYWSWYGFDSHVEWCACFVSWCANECGYIDAGILPKFAACTSQGVPWFKERGQWQDGTYIPSPGDIIFFDWEGDGSADHVGIVERVEGGRVFTVEGNSDNACRQRDYAVGSGVIYGYGVPGY